MMQTDFFTDTLIQLMREAFASEEISSEQRVRIYARIASNRSVETVEQMDFWGNSTIPPDEPAVKDTSEADETNQLWLFPDFETPVPSIKPTTFSLSKIPLGVNPKGLPLGYTLSRSYRDSTGRNLAHFLFDLPE